MSSHCVTDPLSVLHSHILLTLLQIKVHRYWPNKAPAVIGDLMVELMNEQKFDEYMLREFKLTNTKVSLMKTWKQLFFTRTNHSYTVGEPFYVLYANEF